MKVGRDTVSAASRYAPTRREILFGIGEELYKQLYLIVYSNNDNMPIAVYNSTPRRFDTFPHRVWGSRSIAIAIYDTRMITLTTVIIVI